MKGSTHLLLSLSTALLTAAPFLLQITNPTRIIAVILFFLGVFVGALTPDIDKGTEAAIYHSSIPGAKGKKFFLTPVFGFIINWLCYRPVRAVFHLLFGDKIYAKQGHRELPHSPIGIICISAMLTFWIELVCFGLSFIPALAVLRFHLLIIFFGLSFLFGCLLHLVEDTCDNSGVHYLYPFAFKRLRGKLRGDGTDIRPRVYAVILLLSAAAVFIVFFLRILQFTFVYGVAAGLGASAVLWIIFLLASGVPARKGVIQNPKYK
ncbi:MAG TPA: metal-dependent hydrolase [Methanocorpusculum sp.]|nr:metal-dependent hydrolase [Methanocorpusculum sp.]